ncbi:MAG: proline dehydrogenase family protein [Anaerolineae bacterium]
MMRGTLLYLSNNRALRASAENVGVAQRAAGRFVAGTTIDDAVTTVRQLNQQNMLATLDHLGEGVESELDARNAAQEYVRLVDSIQQAGLRSNVSLKLTHFGIDLSDDLAFELVRSVVQRAGMYGNFVRMDMENHPYVDRTLNLYRRLRASGLDNVGVVIQSYLYRSQDDIRDLVELGARVRLCKGAYLEPPDVAFPRKADVDANYIGLAKMLLAPGALAKGVYPAFATHDPAMIEAVKAYTGENKISPGLYEFQMLYGVRRDLQRELVQQGYRVRIYVPFGREWYPYFMRRLAERPANVMFILRNVVADR